MLKIGGKDVIFSKSFLMAQGEKAIIDVPEILAKTIRIVATRKASAIAHDGKVIGDSDADDQVTFDIPYADAGIFSFEVRHTQLVTMKGPIDCRISGSALGGSYMLVHLDIHEGRYDNYRGD